MCSIYTLKVATPKANTVNRDTYETAALTSRTLCTALPPVEPLAVAVDAAVAVLSSSDPEDPVLETPLANELLLLLAAVAAPVLSLLLPLLLLKGFAAALMLLLLRTAKGLLLPLPLLLAPAAVANGLLGALLLLVVAA
jgi:hypothetical protein